LWGGGEQPFLIRLDPERTRIDRVPLPAAATPWVPVALLWDGPDTLWIASSNAGLWRMTRQGRGWSFLQAKVPGLAPDGQTTALYRDGRGRLWVSGDQGLSCFDGAAWHTWDRNIGLKPAPVWALAPLPDGTAWLAYLEPMGLTHVDLTGEVPRVLGHLTQGRGLASNSVYSLASDPEGRLWVGGPRGVQRVDSRGMRLFKRADGLMGTDCNPFSTWVDSTGDVWFGTTTGLVHHLPHARHAHAPLPPPLITSLRLGRLSWERPFQGTWVLDDVPTSDRTLTVRFSSLAFEFDGRLRFQTRMLGLGEDWMDTDIREARYPALPPGRYRLEVRTVLEEGAAGPITSVQFRILPPWWRRWWAWTLWGGCVVAAGAGYLRWRTRRLRRRTEALEQLVRERTGALELSNLALTTISMTDALTGLRNRRYLAQELPSILAGVLRLQRAHLEGRLPDPGPDGCLVFALLDIDHFKRVNDTWGHGAGDRALEQIARILQREARESDLLVRWGGEEILFVGHTSDLDGAAAAVTRLHQAVRDHVFDLETSAPHRLTCSIGFSLYPFQPDRPDATPWEDQVRMADQCLYAAKHSGRDTWIGVAGRPGSDAGLVPRFEQAPQAELDRGTLELRSALPPEELVWRPKP
ncbi:MAG TPA: diguanylate cyclase, partial [Holophagaceae bacterium]